VWTIRLRRERCRAVLDSPRVGPIRSRPQTRRMYSKSIGLPSIPRGRRHVPQGPWARPPGLPARPRRRSARGGVARGRVGADGPPAGLSLGPPANAGLAAGTATKLSRRLADRLLQERQQRPDRPRDRGPKRSESRVNRSEARATLPVIPAYTTGGSR